MHHLLRLPPEIRAYIWECFFDSTTLASGEITSKDYQTTCFKPALYSLALLRVCRQIYNETNHIWLGRVTFDFTDIDWLLNKLTAVSATTLSRIRYIKLSASPLSLSPRNLYDDVFYRLAEALILIPGLRLDTLIVDASCQYAETVYETITGLIENGDGFQELRVILANTAPLSFGRTNAFGPNETHIYQRKPQPQTWNEAMEFKDGVDSGSSVCLYVSKSSGQPVDPWDMTKLTPFAQVPTEDFGIKVDHALATGPDADKGMLVVARRGRNAVITQGRGKPPFNLQDLRDWTYGLSWEEIKAISNRWMEDFRDDSEEYRFEDELPITLRVSGIPRVTPNYIQYLRSNPVSPDE